MNETLNKIRTIEFNNIKIGGESSFPIFKPVFIIDTNVANPQEIEQANHSEADIIGLTFDIETEDEISKATANLKKALQIIDKPIMLKGTGNNDIDRRLLPELMKQLTQPAIIAWANDNTYKDILPEVIKGNHVIVLRSPIDINITKELNILSQDAGLDLNKILIDTDIGGLGYGFEYGYSIMEKIKLEGLNGDKYLNMPIISFACEESLKTKETKSDNYPPSWGNRKERENFFEIASASAVLAAGANVIVMKNSDNIKIMKGLC